METKLRFEQYSKHSTISIRLDMKLLNSQFSTFILVGGISNYL